MRGGAVLRVCAGASMAVAGMLMAAPAPAQVVSEGQVIRPVRLPATSADPGPELAELRTRTSRTFAAKGGSFETRVFDESVNYRDSLGRWQPIDNRLKVDGDVLRNGANRYRLTVPRQLGSGEVRFSARDAWIAFAPRGAGSAARAAARGANARYAGAWPGVDLEYTATGDTVREALVLGSRAAVRDFSFTLRVPRGFVPVQQDTGAIAVRDADGAARLYVAPSTMVDAAGERRAVTSTLRASAEGWTLRLSPDRSWLGSAARRWPVTIDPDVTLPGALACSIENDELSGDSASCGGPLPVGDWCRATFCTWHRALVRFDPAAALPPGAVLEFAALGNTVAEPLPPAYQMTASWDENVSWLGWTDGWGAEGDYVTTPIGDITPLVRDWLSGAQPNYGVLFKQDLSGDPQYIEPYLALQYSPTDDPDGLQGQAASWYAARFGVSVTEAARRLRIQDRVSNVEDDLEAAIAAADFGGIWFDDVNGGRGKIGIETNQPVPPSSKTADALEVLEDHGLEDEVDFVAVPSSLDDLEAASDDLDTPLASLYDQGKIASSIRPQENAIHLLKANSLTPAQEADLADAIAGVDVTVNVQPVNEADVGGDDQDCSEPANSIFLGCTFPLRGGQQIEAPDSTCTAGFNVIGKPGTAKAGKQYVLTAGHCIDGEENSVWKGLLPNGQLTNIGHSRDFQNGPHDYGLIEVESGSDWHAANPVGQIFVDQSNTNGVPTQRDSQYRINDARLSPRKGPRVVCLSSAKRLPDTGSPQRHTECGRIQGFDGKHKKKKNQAEVEFCGVSGASGGPVYKNHHAYGIWSGDWSPIILGCVHGFYEGVKGALDTLGVDLAPPG
jgi:hypothetical protein